jgi:protein-S-isoprenylcysteine O-methyltransferase Ste14
MFPRHGGVPKGRSFVATTRLVDRGIYSVVRHPQYLGGILAIFMATPLLYPHWLLGVLGVLGIGVVYFSCAEEEQRLVRQFGTDYVEYMQRVPRINIVTGVWRRMGNRARAGR